MDLAPHDLSALLPASAPVQVRSPLACLAPVVFASAHSGRDYSAAFIASARLDPLRLRRSEDSFVDELFAAVPDHGMQLVAASFPRAYCDANREPWELDPAMFDEALPPWVNTTSPRVGAGLGTIARVVASGEAIYREKLPFAEARTRVATCWEPFHAALSAQVVATGARFGACLLIDCHSMPGVSQYRAEVRSKPGGVDVVLGDAHGTACHPGVTALVEKLLRQVGFSVRRNDPYAGGYITRHYGRPREGVHAVQIEINRALYMDEARIERLPGFAGIQARLSALVALLGEQQPRYSRRELTTATKKSGGALQRRQV